MNLALAAGTTGVGLATDLQQGIIDRFRTLPMTHTAILIGRTSTDLIRNAVALALMIAAGFAIGFRLDGGLARRRRRPRRRPPLRLRHDMGLRRRRTRRQGPPSRRLHRLRPGPVFVYLSSAWVPIDTMNGAVQASPATNPSTSPSSPSAASPTAPPHQPDPPIARLVRRPHRRLRGTDHPSAPPRHPALTGTVGSPIDDHRLDGEGRDERRSAGRPRRSPRPVSRQAPTACRAWPVGQDTCPQDRPAPAAAGCPAPACRGRRSPTRSSRRTSARRRRWRRC